MTKHRLHLSRRSILAAASTSAAAMLLGGCDRLSEAPSFRNFLASAEWLTYRAQRTVFGRAALAREVREETGLAVTVGEALDEHLFEVLPGRFVRILPFACRLAGGSDVVLSHEHLDTRWLPLGELGETIAGHRLPAGYLAAIRLAEAGRSAA